MVAFFGAEIRCIFYFLKTSFDQSPQRQFNVFFWVLQQKSKLFHWCQKPRNTFINDSTKIQHRNYMISCFRCNALSISHGSRQ